MNREKSLVKYQKVIADLKNYYEDQSVNSITHTIQETAWYDTIYRTFNEGIRLSWKAGKQDSLPASLIDYFHIAHLRYILLNIRKLFDKDKGTNSLPVLIQQIDAYAMLFTRYNYVCYDRLPYTVSGYKTYDEERAYHQNNMRHNMFDLLSDVKNPNERREDDKVDPDILKSLRKYCVLNSDVHTVIDKYIVHAERSFLGSAKAEALSSVTLLKLQRQYKVALWAIQQIGKIIDSHIPTEVPVPQFDQLKGWDTSLFDKRIKKKLNKYWDKRMLFWDNWTKHYWTSNKYFINPYKALLKQERNNP
ncbi:hypothetical protein [Marispirochaeta aestuarii]|uniref:hypothetical protein n=1 Tax=Marispirochaeta aestuarii TaxID=1963862 RepID=UPI0029C97AC8|nr:hypothetical protein [Marispirochaeta aestuarii]